MQDRSTQQLIEQSVTRPRFWRIVFTKIRLGLWPSLFNEQTQELGKGIDLIVVPGVWRGKVILH
jgi:hypothetical protein